MLNARYFFLDQHECNAYCEPEEGKHGVVMMLKAGKDLEWQEKLLEREFPSVRIESVRYAPEYVMQKNYVQSVDGYVHPYEADIYMSTLLHVQSDELIMETTHG